MPTSNSKGVTQQDKNTYVTTALGFFSTAYTLTFRPDSSPAVSEARTSGPRPAPTTIITLTRKRLAINPLCVNGDQHQFSPNNIHTLSRDKVMRINKMIIKEKMLWLFMKFSQHIFYGKVLRSVWRICMWILGLKGLTDHYRVAPSLCFKARLSAKLLIWKWTHFPKIVFSFSLFLTVRVFGPRKWRIV